MMGSKQPPQLSIILLIFDRHRSNQQTWAHLRSQTVVGELEVVIVAVDRVAVNECGFDFAPFKSVKIVYITSMKSTAAARAAGISAASASLVALAEDHSFPEPDWAERLITTHAGPWAAVGPAMGNANPDCALSWANLAIEYGPWLDPASSGAAEHLPGHNSCYKRDLLLQYGNNLESMLEAESILHWDLRSKGHRLYFDAGAKTLHLNYTLFRPALVLRFFGGKLFAAARCRKWTPWKRLVYGVSSPLIPLVRLRRVVQDLRRVGQYRRFRPKILLLLASLLAGDALGEMLGYFFGRGQEMARLSEMEFRRERFMKAEEVRLTRPTCENASAPVE